MLLLHERAKGAASHWADYLQAKHNSATIRVNSDGAIFPAHVQTPALETRSKVGHKHPRSEADGDSAVEGAARLRKKRRKSTKAGKGKSRSKVPLVASPATWSYVYPPALVHEYPSSQWQPAWRFIRCRSSDIKALPTTSALLSVCQEWATEVQQLYVPTRGKRSCGPFLTRTRHV